MSVFLDSELSAAERDPTTARFRIIPMPLEKTVSYGSGTEAGPAAIIEASDQLERLVNGREPCAQGIFTEAPVDCSGSVAEAIAKLRERTFAASKNGFIPVTLGGEHSLSYGAVMGVKDALGVDIGIIQIDAHADLRNAYQGEKHSHASVMHLLAEEGVRLCQFGIRAISTEEVEARQKYNVFHLDAEELATQGIHHATLPDDFPEQVYISFDVDGLDPSVMPATGTPVPGGLGYYQSLHLIESALKRRSCVGMDVVEFAPIAGQQAWDFTATQIVYRLMASAMKAE
jgi:agmatinase